MEQGPNEEPVYVLVMHWKRPIDFYKKSLLRALGRPLHGDEDFGPDDSAICLVAVRNQRPTPRVTSIIIIIFPGKID